jgi:hypothetical protein
MKIELRIPEFLGSEHYFKNGRPCCPLGHILAASPVNVPKRLRVGTEDATAEICNDYVPELAFFLEEKGFGRADFIEETCHNLSTEVDSTRSQSKRHEAVKKFVEKYDIYNLSRLLNTHQGHKKYHKKIKKCYRHYRAA